MTTTDSAVRPVELLLRQRTPISELADLRDYADALRAAAAALGPLPDDTTRSRLVEDARAAVVFADGPMTIGVVGEYNAGKSLLLGMLMDEPELLPVGDDPMTANVTALRLLRAPEGVTRARIVRAEVEYLTRRELDECVRAMVDELARLARDAHLADGAVAALREAGTRWPQLHVWCRDVGWPRADSDLRTAIAEFMRLHTAVSHASDYLDQPAKSVDPEVVKQALRLPAATRDPHVFPDDKAPDVDLAQFPARLRPEQLWVTLPLVMRVTMDVEVPHGAWDISGLRGQNELMLLDFPGLDSAISGVRDRYLSRRELAEIPTILVLLNAAAGARKGPNAFVKMMQRPVEDLRDAVLVGIGRFDQLPGVLPARVTGAPEPGAEPLRERDLEQLLGTVQSAARGLVGSGQDRRIVPLSSMVAIGDLDRRTPGGRHYSEEFARERDLATNVPLAREKGLVWARVGQRLCVDDPAAELGQALVDLGTDGGVGRLRALLETHVIEHGVQQRLRRMRERVRRLDTARLVLVEEVHAMRAAAPAPAEADRRRVTRLVTATRQALERIAKRAATELPDPHTVRSGSRTLADAVAQQAAELVYEWPQWGRLFAAVGRDGMIETPAAPGPHEQAVDDLLGRLRRPARTSSPLPVSTDAFREEFVNACAACEKSALEDAGAALRHWHRRTATAELAEIAAQWAEVLDEPARARLAALPDNNYLDLVEHVVDLSWQPDDVFARVEATAARTEREEPAFPARPGAHFAWDPQAPEAVRAADTGTKPRHQIRPVRLRREFTNAVSAAALTRVGEIQHAVVLVLSAQLEALSTELSANPEEQGAFVDAVVGAADRPGEPAADPADRIARLDPPPAAEPEH